MPYADKEQKKAYMQEYHLKNKEQLNQRAKEYYHKNKKTLRSKMNQYARNLYQETKSETLARTNLQRNKRKQRVPNWLTEDDFWFMEEVYLLAKERTNATGIPWEVDHILPLRGERISGLHVPLNLQVITRKENRSKGNIYG